MLDECLLLLWQPSDGQKVKGLQEYSYPRFVHLRKNEKERVSGQTNLDSQVIIKNKKIFLLIFIFIFFPPPTLIF